MRRWLWWTPLILLTALGAALAFRAGWIAATVSETDVINAQVARYLAQVPGARPEHCHAEPAPGAWLVVICAPPGGVPWSVTVDRRGRVVSPLVPEA